MFSVLLSHFRGIIVASRHGVLFDWICKVHDKNCKEITKHISPFTVFRKKKAVEVKVAMRELQEKKEEEQLALVLKDKIKRNSALKMILNTIKVRTVTLTLSLLIIPRWFQALERHKHLSIKAYIH